jgi:hypothetical protein
MREGYRSAVRIFKNKWFDRFARKAGISDDSLKSAAADIEKGLWDANYGGDVYKKRFARKNAGKSGGFRSIIIFRAKKLTYFAYAFPKSGKDDINDKEERMLKADAADILEYTEAQLQARVDEGSFIEIL